MGETNEGATNQEQHAVPRNAIEQQIDRILAHASFRAAPLLSRFLRFIVTETLDGRGPVLKQYTIAVRGLNMATSFNPESSSLIRVHARRLRQLLRDYYAGAGLTDPVRITLPEGAYIPAFAWNRLQGEKIQDDASPTHSSERTLSPHSTKEASTGGPNIAVVEFANLGLEDEWRYFPNGLTEELLMMMAQSPDFTVMGPFNRDRLRDDQIDLHTLGTHYGAQFVLDGSVQRTTDLLRVRVRLLDGAAGIQVWGHTYHYDVDGAQLLEIEQAVVTHVGRHLGDEFGVVNRYLAQRALVKPISRLSMYEAFLRARLYLLNLTEESLRDAIAASEHAVRIMPDSALACAVHSVLLAVTYIWPSGDTEPFPQHALIYAERALRLDMNNPWVLLSTGFTKRLAGDPEGDVLFRRLLERPCSPSLLGVAATMNTYAKIDNDESLRLIQRAQALNPHYPRYLNFGACLIYLDRGEDALALRELDAHDVRNHYTDPLIRAAIFCRQGNFEAARRQSERVVNLYPEFPLRGFALLARYYHPDYLHTLQAWLAPLALDWTPPPRSAG